MNIRNGFVLRGEDNCFVRTDISMEAGKIKAFGTFEETAGDYDAEGLYVIPGFIDTHIHGSVGVEFAAADEDFEKARTWLAAQGITGFAPTVRALPVEETVAAEKNIVRESRKTAEGAKILGIHIEGPFVSHKRRGAMIPPEIECAPEALAQMAEAGEGMLKIMTMAPERENALSVIKTAGELGVNISLGHSEADYDVAEAAIEAGAVRVTHVFDAMRPFYHRETGILGAALTDDRVNCEMICDFVHLDEIAVKLVYRLKGAERITLISDSGKMSGLGDGEYEVGGPGRIRIVKNGVCRNLDGTIAGSTVSMLAGARNLVRMGVPLEEVSVMGALNPARVLGAEASVGSLLEGKSADIVVCDKELNIKAVFIDGRPQTVI